MSKIYVPITKDERIQPFIGLPTTLKLAGLFLLFVASSALGAFMQSKYPILRFPFIDPKTQLGAAGGAFTPSESPTSTAISTESAVPSETFTTDTSLPSLADQKTDERINELEISINEHKDALRQLHKEIELIKDRSVALIVEFNQNCGNWRDDCAAPYAKELELNNSRYSELISKLSVFDQELQNAENERKLLNN